ncbi:MAG: hypothetical protein H0Z33_06775 [Bacillaceae bacterium]|nr:hypothetical protein [Bacillaceae bacterium]
MRWKPTGWIALFTCVVFLAAGCNQQGQNGQMGTQGMEQMTENMARSEQVQTSFSRGRVDVMKQDHQARKVILQNVLTEQNMMLEDPELRSRLLDFNIEINRLMTRDEQGLEQLKVSSIKSMEGITHDTKAHRQMFQIEQLSRQKSLKDPKLRNQLLTQNIQEFSAVSNTPPLRSKMADAMLPLLKDPKIAAELEKMIQMAVQKEVQKIMAQMKQQQPKQPAPSQPKKDESGSGHQPAPIDNPSSDPGN